MAKSFGGFLQPLMNRIFKHKFFIPAATILAVLLIDQWLKIYVKLNFHYQESRTVTRWFQIFFIENEGMAFGLKWGGVWGKLMLTTFRLLFVTALAYYLITLVKKKAHTGFVFCMCLIFAGAMGNIIDSVFYGIIFNDSTIINTAKLFPAGGGYGHFLEGKVVDMLYFPLWHGTLPHWLPFIGGHEFSFFDPIFNIADASISIGVFLIIIFQGRFFKKKTSEDATIYIGEQNIEKKEINEVSKQDDSINKSIE